MIITIIKIDIKYGRLYELEARRIVIESNDDKYNDKHSEQTKLYWLHFISVSGAWRWPVATTEIFIWGL